MPEPDVIAKKARRAAAVKRRTWWRGAPETSICARALVHEHVLEGAVGAAAGARRRPAPSRKVDKTQLPAPVRAVLERGVHQDLALINQLFRLSEHVHASERQRLWSRRLTTHLRSSSAPNTMNGYGSNTTR